jgi:hypothetical protein
MVVCGLDCSLESPLSDQIEIHIGGDGTVD